jgi:hypothetical protein
MLDRLVQYLDYKAISVYSLESSIGVAKGTIYRAIRQNANISSNVVSKIVAAYPDLSLLWLFTGKGDMLTDGKDMGVRLSEGLEVMATTLEALEDSNDDEDGDHTLEVVKREDGTEFRDMGDGRWLMVTPLIEQYAYAGYHAGFTDSHFIDELPRHAIVVDKLHFGTYRAFTVKGDSMDNNSKEAISSGDIITGRKIDPKYWNNKLHLHKYQDFIIHTVDGIIVKRILEHNVNEGWITCHSLNEDKSTYPDITVTFEEIKELYNIVSVTRSRR